MKRDLLHLQPWHIEGIQLWLENANKRRVCPFKIPARINDCDRCHEIFPSNPRVKYLCPCQLFSLSYVKRVARQVIKQWEAEHDPSK